MAEGTVKWFNDSKGFFDFRGKCDAFVHRMSIQGNGCKSVGHATGGVGGMAWIRRIGFTVLLAVGVFITLLAAPGVAMAAVGGPYSESVSNPDDNGIINVGTGGGSWDSTSGLFGITVPDGALSTATTITVNVWRVSGGPKAPDGGDMRYVIQFQPDGLGFAKAVTVRWPAPAGFANANFYEWNTGTGSWVRLASTKDGTASKNGDKVTTNIGHFSWYGLGGDPPRPVPASSSWSIGLLALIGAAIAAGMTLRRRRSLRTSPRRN